MSSGIRATVTISSPEGCRIGRVSERNGTTIEGTATSPSCPGDSGSVTEFLADPDSVGEADDVDGPVFSYGTADVYRFEHTDATCPCERLSEFGCPVHRYVASDGDVTLVFHAADFETLQAVIDDLQDRFEAVDVQQLLQPPLQGSPEERVFVNRGKLTDRQREVLETAFEMGYFERPKRANATEIAAELDISQSTFTEHLVTAQRKLLTDVFDTDG